LGFGSWKFGNRFVGFRSPGAKRVELQTKYQLPIRTPLPPSFNVIADRGEADDGKFFDRCVGYGWMNEFVQTASRREKLR
jgi:hypothetical protein